MRPQTALAIALMSAMPVTNAVAAADLCQATSHLVEMARQNYSVQPDPKTVSELASGLGGSNGPANCRIVVKPDRKSHLCMWQFSYRDHAAMSGFDRLSDSMATCLDARELESRDTPVNHPDSYEQRRFELDGASVSISIKDKAALGKTLVFFLVDEAGL